MVEINELIGNEYISVEAVKNAKDKRVVIINEGEVTETKYGDKLKLIVQLDTETKEWTMNKETLRNLREQFGTETKDWVGKMVMLSTAEKNGNKYVVGFPL